MGFEEEVSKWMGVGDLGEEREGQRRDVEADSRKLFWLVC
jgi:hypothetical protein